MSGNVIPANPEHYIFKMFWGSMPPDPLEGLKNIFLAAAWLKNFFRIDFSPKQKILNRTLAGFYESLNLGKSYLKCEGRRFPKVKKKDKIYLIIQDQTWDFLHVNPVNYQYCNWQWHVFG